MTSDPGLHVCGADGCRGGWAVATLRGGEVSVARVERLADVLAGAPTVLAVDMPIGLPTAAERGGRLADRLARQRLDSARGRSVFSPPARAALGAETHAQASAANRASGPDAVGLSQQAFGLFPKIREVDALVTPAMQDGDAATRIVEAHPEVAFAEMSGGPGLGPSKKTAEGRALRLGLLRAAGIAAPETFRLPGVPLDDVVDALACLVVAVRVAEGTALRLPPDPPRDARGLAMEIWG